MFYFRIIFLAFSFILIHSFIFGQVFTANPNVICAEATTLNFSLNVSGLPPQSDENYGFFEVGINLNHTSASDVELELESPSGTKAYLVYGHGGANNFSTASFRIYANNSIRYMMAPFSGVYMADQSLRNFTDGQNPNGVWKLNYYDHSVNGISGTLVSWNINFVATPHTNSLFSSSTNLPIFKIDVPSGTIPDDPKVPAILKILNAPGAPNSFNASSYQAILSMAIERQGYTSAWNDKPNYDFELQNSLGNDTAISLLGLPAESDWILKACVTDDYMCKDPLTFEMSRRMGYYAPRTKYVELMVQDQYVGVYVLTEKLKRDSNRIDIAKLTAADTVGPALTGGYIFEVNPNGDPAAWYSNYLGYQGPNLTFNYEFKVVYPKQSSLHPNQLNYLHAYVDSFENALSGVNFQDPINGWRKYASEKDLIDFLIVSEYSTNYDTYGRSTYLYKEKISDGNKIHCGPPWDADRGYCCDTGWVHIITHGYWVFPFWWQKLRTDSIFNKNLACRFSSLRKDVLTTNAFHSFIDSNENYIRHAVQRNVNRWQNYIDPIQNLKTNVSNRLAWMQNQLNDTSFAPLPLTQTIFCAGDPINIFIGNQYTYNFKPGPDTSFFIPTVAGNYQAVVSTQFGCETKQAIIVTPKPAPMIVGNQYPCRNSIETYTVLNIPGSTNVWTVNGGTPVSGCGLSDTSCSVHWGNPTFCLVKIKQSLSITCSDTDVHPITIQTCTGVNNLENKKIIQVYPSPVHDVLFISPKALNVDATIYDATGRFVMLVDENEVNVSALLPGIYLIILKDEDNVFYHLRFLKD